MCPASRARLLPSPSTAQTAVEAAESRALDSRNPPSMMNLRLFAGGMLVTMASALPQAITVTTSAAALCTETATALGIDHTVTNYENWASSISVAQGTASKSGSKIPVYTNVINFPGLGIITAYNYADSNFLTSVGYKIVTNTVTVTGTCRTTTASILPSPTGSICSLHGDHCTRPFHSLPCVSDTLRLQSGS